MKLQLITILLFCILNIIYFLPKILINKLKYDNIIFNFTSKINKKEIILTIDDIPYGNINSIRKVLNKYNIKANFFFISNYLTNKTKSNLINLINDGHEIYNHGMTNSMHAKLNKYELLKEINECSIVLEKLYNETNIKKPINKYYRPGSGYFNKEMLDVIKYNNMKIVLGSVYPHDAQISLSLLNFYYIIYKIEPGDIIILHDRLWTSELLNKLIPYLLYNGYSFNLLSNLE